MAQATENSTTTSNVVQLRPAAPPPRRMIQVWVDADAWELMVSAARGVQAYQRLKES